MMMMMPCVAVGFGGGGFGAVHRDQITRSRGARFRRAAEADFCVLAAVSPGPKPRRNGEARLAGSGLVAPRARLPRRFYISGASHRMFVQRGRCQPATE